MRKTSIKKFTTVLFLFTMLYYLIGCSHVDKDSISSEKLNNATPQELVELYYDSLSMEDINTVILCLSTDYAEFLQKNAEIFDRNNLKKITDIKVTPASPIKLHNENYDEVQVVVEYNAIYKKIMTVDNGTIKICLCSKKTQDSPWEITSIGTGP